MVYKKLWKKPIAVFVLALFLINQNALALNISTLRPVALNNAKTNAAIQHSFHAQNPRKPPQHIFQAIIDRRLPSLQKDKFTEVVIIMDKDGTVSRINEVVDESMLDKLMQALILDAKLVVCTGGMLMHSVDNFIKPLEARIKKDGLAEKFPNIKYFFMNGAGKVTWGDDGNRIIEYSEAEFSATEQLKISKSLALAFIEVFEKRFSALTTLEEFRRKIAEAEDEITVRETFAEFIKANKDIFGVIVINNGYGRQFTLEFKGSEAAQANPELQDIRFTKEINKIAIQKLGEIAPKLVVNYGSTYVDCNIIDKEKTVLSFLGEGGFINPLIVALGDGRNDFGFLQIQPEKGILLPFFVGNDFEDMPEGIIIWPQKGPYGTEEIFSAILLMVESSDLFTTDNYVNFKTDFYKVHSIIISSA